MDEWSLELFNPYWQILGKPSKTFFSELQFSENQTHFWKTLPIYSYLLNSLSWMSFPEISLLTCPKILKSAIGCVFQKSIQLMPRKFSNQGLRKDLEIRRILRGAFEIVPMRANIKIYNPFCSCHIPPKKIKIWCFLWNQKEAFSEVISLCLTTSRDFII